jgi:hypothetical protein
MVKKICFFFYSYSSGEFIILNASNNIRQYKKYTLKIIWGKKNSFNLDKAISRI